MKRQTRTPKGPLSGVDRRGLLKGLVAGAAGVTSLGTVGSVSAQRYSQRTVVFGSWDADQANGEATTEKDRRGRGSWVSEGDGDGDGSDDKFFFWIDPKRGRVNLGSFTINAIEQISFWTHKPVPEDEPDFYLSIYTEPDGEDDDASWYGHRLNGVPNFSRNLDGPANQWNEWNARNGFTGSEANELGFSDNHHHPGTDFHGAPTLSDLQDGPVDWSEYHSQGDETAINYGSAVVKSLVLATGTPWSDAFKGYLDAITIKVSAGPGNSNRGQSVLVDLEP